MPQKILTKEGLEKIKLELKDLKEVKLPDIIDKIEKAKELGDLSENAEYHDAKDQQGMIVSRITEIEAILKNAIINEEEPSKHEVSLGSTFVVKDEDGKEKEFTLVGFNEADPLNGRISNESPMGQAFYGRKEGEKVSFEAPRGTVHYTIIKIV
jgi:transcription elongation factor GreA